MSGVIIRGYITLEGSAHEPYRSLQDNFSGDEAAIANTRFQGSGRHIKFYFKKIKETTSHVVGR